MTKGVQFHRARGPDGMRIYAVGDVHGRLDLLTEMHARIAEEIETFPPADWRVIHLGDYVDRGPDSKGVLQFLVEAQTRDPRHLALAGNHDLGFIEFMADPQQSGLFAQYGGVTTARSYGVELDTEDLAKFGAGHAALMRAVPPAHLDFLLDLGFSQELGDFFFCHAGVRPTLPLNDQSPDDLVWIRHDFLDWEQPLQKVIIHGHTPVFRAEIRPNRVNVDTGAFRSGRLTALVIDGDKKRLLEIVE